MRCRFLPLALGLLLATAACGPAELVLTVEIDVDNPEGDGMVSRALSDLEVQIIPFDRDAVFDSMTSAFGTPEPAIPQELTEARDQVRLAQGTWQQATNRWQTIRDTLIKLNDAIGQYNRGEARYVALFREWQDFDRQLAGTERSMNTAFETFNQLQQGTIRQSDSIRIMRENWGDEAFAGVGDVWELKRRATGLAIVVDTTDASGVARMEAKPGQYWVHARYELAYTELYWNVPVPLQRGDPITFRLTRENALERPKL